jgi:hypothetical protein
MRKLAKNYPVTSGILGTLLIPIFVSFFEQAGGLILDWVYSTNICTQEDSLCVFSLYAIVIFLFGIPSFIVENRKRKEQEKNEVKLRELIQEGSALLASSRRTNEYKLKQKEWWLLAKKWDAEKMKPFIKMHLGESFLSRYDFDSFEHREIEGDDKDYDKKRSIIAIRLERANNLLEKYFD